uniref:CCHC-type domain-containing protein n=1 Tax=Panagrolaimus superbus TaxID=310955 RepID=A0A914Y6Z4_9BILA
MDNNDKCKRCGGIPHKLDSCPAKDYYCHICGKTGHYLEFCILPINDEQASKTPSLNNEKSKGGCKHCGTTHAYRNCPAHNSKCIECHGRGHFSQFCQSLKQGSSKNSLTPQKNRSETSTPVTSPPMGTFKRRDSGSTSSSKSIIKEKPTPNKAAGSTPAALKKKCNKCGTLHEPNKCPAKNEYCTICKKNEHFEEFCIFKDINKHRKADPPSNTKKKAECKKCGKIHSFGDCPAKNEYCKNCHLQGHFTQCCRISTPENIGKYYDITVDLKGANEEWKRDEQNALCRYIFTAAKEEYGKNASGPVLEKRKQKAIEIRLKQINETSKEQKKARNLELCFLVDATGSMKNHIVGVKKYINDIVDAVIQPQANMCQYGWADNVRLAFVGYRDFGDVKQFECLNNGKFTESIKDFKEFCDKLEASGRGDDAEDVFGGLDKALSLDWNNEYGTKVIYHIADAPCHGKKYHNLKKGDDKFYDLGHPNGLTDKRLFSKLLMHNRL